MFQVINANYEEFLGICCQKKGKSSTSKRKFREQTRRRSACQSAAMQPRTVPGRADDELQIVTIRIPPGLKDMLFLR